MNWLEPNQADLSWLEPNQADLSWLEPNQADRDYVQQLQQDFSQHYQLLRVLALALRIEPLLLRNARLQFAPGSDIELETEIWFSPMMHSRNARACIIRGGVARILADELGNSKSDYATAWAFVQTHTRHWRGQYQMEQQLRHAVRTNDSQALQNGFQQILNTLVNTPDDGDKRDLSRWLKGAIPGLLTQNVPSKIADLLFQYNAAQNGPSEIAHLLFQYTAAALGLTASWSANHQASLASMPQWLLNALPESKDNSLGIQFHESALECTSAESAKHRLSVKLPIPTPVLINSDRENAPRWESLWPGRKIRLSPNYSWLNLQTLDGQLYRFTVHDYKPSSEPVKTSSTALKLFYMPEDREQANQISELLRQQGIIIELVPELNQFQPSQSSEQHVIRLWSRASADYWQQSLVNADYGNFPPGLLLRIDSEVELPKGTIPAQVINLNETQNLASSINTWLETSEILAQSPDKSYQNNAIQDKETERKNLISSKIFIVQIPQTEQSIMMSAKLSNDLSLHGIQVLVDETGQTSNGGGWTHYHEECIFECHSAVILFSRNALEKTDLHRNIAAILSWRNRLQLDFVLIGVLLEEITDEDFEKSFFYFFKQFKCIRAFNFDGIQFANEILPKLSYSQTPFDLLLKVADNLLNKINYDVLFNAIESFNKAEKNLLDSRKEPIKTIVQIFLRNPEKVFFNLQLLIDKIGINLDNRQVRNLIDLFKGFWIPLESAAELDDMLFRGVNVVMNGEFLSDFTLPCYLKRIYFQKNFDLFPIQWDGTITKLLYDIGQYAPRTVPERGRKMFISESKHPIVVLITVDLNFGIPDEDLLNELKMHYPNIKVIIDVGSERISEKLLDRNVQPLRCTINLEDELEQWIAYGRLLDFVDRIGRSDLDH